MTYYINSKKEYPRHIGDIQLEYPDWQHGDDLPIGWQEVAEGVIPEVTENEYWVEIEPAEVDGVLTRQFEVLPITDEMIAEQKLFAIRLKVASGQLITSAEAKLLVG